MQNSPIGSNEVYLKLGICVLIGVILWFLPIPESVPRQGWRILSVFIPVIISFIIRPFPIGAMVLFGLVTLTITGTITMDEALTGYGNKTVWLVVAAFLIAGSVIKTGFGRRIALILVSRFGKSIIGLGYAIVGSELILGPIVPSNTARGGGILAPITRSLSETLESFPDDHPEKAGSYLTLVGAHANLITAAMFLTGMAANPLLAEAASDIFNIDFSWGMWALGSIAPGILGLALLPIFIKYLSRPTLTDTRAAQKKAKEDLKEMGNWTTHEKIMAFVFIGMLILWSTKYFHGMGATMVAWIGLSILVLTRTQLWNDIVSNSSAWDTLIWLGGLLTMANMLKDYGLVNWFAETMQIWVSDIGGVTVVIVLALIYFYSMYAFSMLTAHISALVAAFFVVAFGVGAPGLLTVALLAYFSNLCACTTNYSTGPVIIYFGLGYVDSPKWFKTGFLVSLFHIAIWLTVGMAWWKLLGWW